MKQVMLGIVVFFIYRLYSLTWRYKIICDDKDVLKQIKKDMKRKKPSPGENNIYAFWHQDELALLGYFSYRRLVAMVSYSKDGNIMNTLLRLMGYQTVRGSSSRKAISGFIASYKMIQEGHKFTMAIDGPRGPIFKVKEGIIKMSEKSGRPIVPVRSFPRSYFLFNKAWNQAKLPKPFSKIEIHVGNPKMYQRQELEDILNSFTPLQKT